MYCASGCLQSGIRASRDKQYFWEQSQIQLRKASSGSINPLVRQSINPLVRQSVSPSLRQSVTPSLRQSVSPLDRQSVYKHATSPLTLNGSSWNYVLRIFTEICWESSSLVEIGHCTWRHTWHLITLLCGIIIGLKRGMASHKQTQHNVTSLACRLITARIPTQSHNESHWGSVTDS
jgi:hypothetical protein